MLLSSHRTEGGVGQWVGLRLKVFAPSRGEQVMGSQADEAKLLCHAGQGHVDNVDARLTVLVLPLLSLIAACMLKIALKKRSAVPSTVVLLLLGVLFGVISCVFYVPLLTESFSLWGMVDPPDVILYAILPPLLYEGAQNMDWFYFRKNLLRIAVLAFIMVPIHAIIVAVCLLFALRLPWSMSASMMFGALLSATDPVAVVSLLKSSGAPKTLLTIIEGESLFNDGTGYVLFEIFLHEVVNEASGVPAPSGIAFLFHILYRVVYLSVGGITFGFLFGLVMIWMLSFLHNDNEVEVGATFALAYCVFYIAQGPLHLSGPIATVAFGLVMSASGIAHITPEVQHSLHSFWEIISFCMNAIAFLYSGALCAMMVLTEWNDSISSFDIMMIPVLYVILHITRALSLLIVMPVLRMEIRHVVMLALSGLRGSIALVMGLQLAYRLQESDIPNAVYDLIAPRVFLWTSGVVCLTLLINGSLVGQISQLLGISRMSIHQKIYLDYARVRLRMVALKSIQAIETSKRFGQADGRTLRKLFNIAEDEADADNLEAQTSTSCNELNEEESVTLQRPGTMRNLDETAPLPTADALSTKKDAITNKNLTKLAKKATLGFNLKHADEPFAARSGGHEVTSLPELVRTESRHSRSESLSGVRPQQGMQLSHQLSFGKPSETEYIGGPLHKTKTELGILLSDSRRRVLLNLRRDIQYQYEKGLVSPAGNVILRSVINEELSDVDSPFNFGNQLFVNVHGFSKFQSEMINFFSRRKSTRWISKRLLNMVQYRHVSTCDAATACWIAVLQVRKKKWIPKEVQEELEHERRTLLRYLRDLEANYPSVLRMIHTQQAMQVIFRSMEAYIDTLESNGVEDNVLKKLREETEDILFESASQIPSLMLEHSKFGGVEYALVNSPIIAPLEPACADKVLTSLAEKSRDFFLQKRDVLLRIGEISSEIYILLRGSVVGSFSLNISEDRKASESTALLAEDTHSEDPEDEDAFLPVGSLIGVSSFSGIPQMRNVIVESEAAHFLVVRKEKLTSLCHEHPEFDLAFRRFCAVKVVSAFIPGAIDAQLGENIGDEGNDGRKASLRDAEADAENKRLIRFATISNAAQDENVDLLSGSETYEDLAARNATGLMDLDPEEAFGARLLKLLPAVGEVIHFKPNTQVYRTFIGVLLEGTVFRIEGRRQALRKAPAVMRSPESQFRIGPGGALVVLIPHQQALEILQAL
ncbi:Sodium/hydrogen exchanger 7 [Porphyridium purpureum]|uniref:Sodium/hydrogen exchanger 7 n=1 Tax=Porphyridium purpureum TaxID=35688 RepID=A0A5J4YU80_PORPP|nr:Sodium/hydrogen exchanger 7 [Porphyridium purpureum]|eukprot:POR0158..scf227_4